MLDWHLPLLSCFLASCEDVAAYAFTISEIWRGPIVISQGAGTEPSLMLLITPVLFLQWQVEMSAVKKVY